MNRRSFLRTGLALAGICALSERCAAAGDFTIGYKIHDGFTEEEESILDKALQYLANRFTDVDVRRNCYRLDKNGYYLDRGVWAKSNLEEDDDYDGKHDLLRFQLIQLRVKGRDDEFPRINILPDHERADWWGEASGDPYQVAVISSGSRFRTEGEFEIKLNRWHLGARGRGSDPEIWAAVMAHEMLHNLGHLHEKGDYSNSWQMNVFENCFYCNGTYRGGERLLKFT